MGKGREIMGFPLTGFYNPVEDPRANSTVFCEDVVSECIAQVFIQDSCCSQGDCPVAVARGS